MCLFGFETLTFQWELKFSSHGVFLKDAEKDSLCVDLFHTVVVVVVVMVIPDSGLKGN